jgi:phosphate:Na+ symporter
MAKGLPIANLANRCVGLIATMTFMPSVVDVLVRWGLGGAPGVAVFHLLFNGILAALMLPLLGPAARILERIFPARPDPADPTRPIYLDPSAREVPSVGLVMATRETLRLADALQAILQDARRAMTSTAPKQISALKSREDILDRLNSEIRGYLAGFERDGLSEADERRMHQILTFATNIEQAGDVVEKALIPHLSKRLKRGLLPSQKHQAELVSMVDRLIQNTRAASSLIMSDDTDVARDLAGEKLVFRQAEQMATTNHFSRMRDGVTAASQSEGLQVEIIRDMKLINSHIIAAAAYPLLEEAGELLPVRLSVGSAI